MRYAQTKLHYICGFILWRPAHTACVHTTPLPTSYGIDLTDLRRLGRLDQVPRSTVSTIEDSTTFSISMCFNNSTMYFQVHGTGIVSTWNLPLCLTLIQYMCCTDTVCVVVTGCMTLWQNPDRFLLKKYSKYLKVLQYIYVQVYLLYKLSSTYNYVLLVLEICNCALH